MINILPAEERLNVDRPADKEPGKGLLQNRVSGFHSYIFTLTINTLNYLRFLNLGTCKKLANRKYTRRNVDYTVDLRELSQNT